VSRDSRWAALRRHYWLELWMVALIAALVLVPWLVGLGLGIWFLTQQGWAWYWWAGSMLLAGLGIGLLRIAFRRKPPQVDLAEPTPGAPFAEQQVREALARLAETATADDLKGPEAVQLLVTRAFRTVADTYSPGDEAAHWRFTLPELLLMLEDLARGLRASLMRDFPMLRYLELTWAIKVSDAAEPIMRAWDVVRALRWMNPPEALLAELRGGLTGSLFDRIGTQVKAQIAAVLIQEAGEAAIRLYAGHYRRRGEELLPTAPEPIADTPPAILTVLLAGQRNAGKSALLNALLGRAREPIGLLTPATLGCRAYAFTSERAGELVLVDCPGADDHSTDAWLAQAAKSDLVLWVAAANRADRAGDQRALAALDRLTAHDPRRRAIPRVLVLTHADRLAPPLEWEPPYDPEQGLRPKEIDMREARLAACEQLGIAEHRCVLLALPPEEPPWNLEALADIIHDALPEAQQKQLERGQRADGWFKVLTDGVPSLPRSVRRAVKTLLKGRKR